MDRFNHLCSLVSSGNAQERSFATAELEKISDFNLLSSALFNPSSSAETQFFALRLLRFRQEKLLCSFFFCFVLKKEREKGAW